MSKPRYYSLQSFLTYMSKHLLRNALVFVSFLISDVFLAVIPLFIGRLVGALAATPPNRHQALLYVILLIICSSGHDLFWRIAEYLYMRLLTKLLYEYENILFQMVIQKPYHYFVDKFTGKIGSYIGTIGEEFRTLTSTLYWDYAGQLISLISVIIILTALRWEIGATFAVGVVLMFIAGYFTIRPSAKYEKIAADVESTKRGQIIDTIANFVNVKSFQKEMVETKAIQREQTKTLHAYNRSFLWGMFFWGSMSFFVRQLIWPSTILLNLYLFLHHTISLAQFATFISSILLFSGFIWEIIWNISQLNLKLAKVEEAHQYLFGPVNVVNEFYAQQSKVATNTEFTSQLQLRDVSFAYPDKEDVPVLSHINLELRKGEKIGVVGKSGSGKTTLTKLLLGYYEAVAGQILLDGQMIDTTKLAQLISYVPQDTTLFHRTIAENIAYASDKKVKRSDIILAAKRAHAHEFISDIAGTYDVLVGERGVKLSAGQRQRIAIARAFLDDQPILVLDEATSALDSESELLVQEALEALWQDKTVIAIAHRLSTLRHMDRIIVMDKGQIVESGTHNELLKQKGKYSRLWSHQSGGFLDE